MHAILERMISTGKEGMRLSESSLLEQIKSDAIPFREFNATPIVKQVRNAKYVLLGEATHGTSEFYTIRSEISKTLIQEKGFSFIAVEGDWPSCYALNRYVKGYSNESNVYEVLRAFNRWPTWMWANREIAELAEWLKAYNATLPMEKRVGFYGMDIYSLWESIDEVIQHLTKAGSPELETAKKVFSCFEPFERDGHEYGISASFFSTDCEEEVVQLLVELQKKRRISGDDQESELNLEINSLVALHAERYYRAMVKGGPDSWNIRDTHMVEVAHRLMNFHGSEAKAIIWEHNTHVGDARATDMVEDGEINVGQLLREQHEKDEVYIVGFGTYRGTVIAAREWGAPMEEMTVPPAARHSWEDYLHLAGPEHKVIFFSPEKDVYRKIMGHRAIGVVYHPRYERGNYVPTRLADRYDAFIYVDETKALSPLVLERVFV